MSLMALEYLLTDSLGNKALHLYFPTLMYSYTSYLCIGCILIESMNAEALMVLVVR